MCQYDHSHHLPLINACRSILPTKTLVAGPVMKTLLPALHSMVSSPPGSETCTGPLVNPCLADTTAAAHAPVPQAKVGPAPRSQTRTLIRPGSTTSTNSTLAFWGQTELVSRVGPHMARLTLSTWSTKTTAWGLPMETGWQIHSCPEAEMAIVPPPAKEKSGSPISTR